VVLTLKGPSSPALVIGAYDPIKHDLLSQAGLNIDGTAGVE